MVMYGNLLKHNNPATNMVHSYYVQACDMMAQNACGQLYNYIIIL